MGEAVAPVADVAQQVLGEVTPDSRDRVGVSCENRIRCERSGSGLYWPVLATVAIRPEFLAIPGAECQNYALDGDG